MDTANNAFLRPLRLFPSVPTELYVMLAIIHLPAIYLPWSTSIPVYFKVSLSAGVALSLAYHIFFGRLVKTATVMDEAVLHANDEWQIRMANGETSTAMFGERQFVQPWLTILELKQGKTSYFLLLTESTTNRTEFRHLRTRILHRLGT